MLTIISIIVAIIMLAFLVLKYDPTFGGKPSKERVDTFGQSENYHKGKFINQISTEMDMKFTTMLGLMRDFIKGNPNKKPAGSLPMESVELLWMQGNSGQTDAKVTWFGHSALLLQIDGKVLLLDPMFGRAPSPFPRFGGKRYSGRLPFEIEELPMIDAILLSHDHYDHLDFGSIKMLKDKVGHFFVPLGVGSHLERWGVDPVKITEHDWWNESEFDGLTFACTPARHFSGRGLRDRDRTLWCSWVIAGERTKVYFSGDSGYGPHFAEIGEKYGPFDMTFMECGQYDERWSAIHMMPEETVQAHVDVKGNVMIPIHWAAFTLSLHDWTDPVERAVKAAKERGVEVATPKIGETVKVGAGEYPTVAWWR